VADQDLGEWAPWVVWEQGGVTTGTLRSPATGDSILAVAAHVTRACWIGEDALTHCGGSISSIGGRAFFSSRGPRRDGLLGLDLSAPGASVVSARSTATAYTAFAIVAGGAHVALQGTSMAAPHVAGAVALLLSQAGWHDATPSRIRARLAGAARADARTGSVPNSDWGAGKLDVANALDLTPTAVASSPPAEGRLRLEPASPNPFNPRTAVRIVLPRAERLRVRVHGPGGALVRTLLDGRRTAGAHRVEWDGRDESGRPVASGVYYVVATAGRETVARKATLLK
jgi:subtilisin family serine protease